jgi:hypothetical protein
MDRGQPKITFRRKLHRARSQSEGGRAQRQNSDRLGAVSSNRRGPKVWKAPDVARQLVIALSGTVVFETLDGRFELRPGDILFTEDTSCAGHNRKFVSDEPWRYTVLDADTVVPFRPVSAPGQSSQHHRSSSDPMHASMDRGRPSPGLIR